MANITEEQLKQLEEKKMKQQELIRELDEVVEAMKELREKIPPDLQGMLNSTSALARERRSGKEITEDPQKASLFDDISGALVVERLRKIGLEEDLEDMEKDIQDLEELMK